MVYDLLVHLHVYFWHLFASLDNIAIGCLLDCEDQGQVVQN